MLACFYIDHIYCFVTAYTPKRVDGYVQRMVAYVNKWSSCQFNALVIIFDMTPPSPAVTLKAVQSETLQNVTVRTVNSLGICLVHICKLQFPI